MSLIYSIKSLPEIRLPLSCLDFCFPDVSLEHLALSINSFFKTSNLSRFKYGSFQSLLYLHLYTKKPITTSLHHFTGSKSRSDKHQLNNIDILHIHTHTFFSFIPFLSSQAKPDDPAGKLLWCWKQHLGHHMLSFSCLEVYAIGVAV